MFGPYMVFRAQHPAGFRTFYFVGLKQNENFSAHTFQEAGSLISVPLIMSHIKHFQQRFSSFKTEVTVNSLKVVYWKVD